MKLIINADDFGMTKSVNKAVAELAQLGTLTSTTVMVNMPYWSEVTDLLQYPNFGIGLHFNLTQGCSISPVDRVPSLVDENGNFFSFNEFRKKSKKGLINKDEVLIELQAQFHLLYNVIGDRLTHIDSHQGVHKYRPVSDAIFEFGKSVKSIGLRSPKHFFIINKDILYPSLRSIFTFGLKRTLVERYYSFYQDKFLQYFKMPDGELLDKSLKKVITFHKLAHVKSNQDYILEIPCHPAITKEDLPKSKLTDKRVEEYKILKSQEFIVSLQKFELTNFKNI